MKLTQNIKYIAKSSLVLILASSIIYAATDILPQFNPGDTLKQSKINAMVDKINALEESNTSLINEVNTLKNQNVSQQTEIDNVVAASGNGIVALKATKTVAATAWSIWDITGLIVGKPVIFVVKGDGGNKGNHFYFRTISGAANGYSNGTTWMNYVGNGDSYRAASSSILIPTDTTISLNVKGHGATLPTEVYVYQ